MSGSEFIPNYDVEMTLLLDPDLIEVFIQLQDEYENFSLTWQKKLTQESLIHPLFDAENWLILSADQQHPHGKTGYRTVWDYLNWQAIASQSDFDEGILDGIVHFLKDYFTVDLKKDAISDEQSIQMVTRLVELLGQFNPDLLSGNTTLNERLVTDIVEILQEPLRQTVFNQIEKILSNDLIAITESPLLEAMIRFFHQENWSFTEIEIQHLLYFKFAGKNGQWGCFTLVQEAEERIVFYSVLEDKVPEEKRPSMAEFICHVNYGLPVGHFELNFRDGELRCKTSLEAIGISPNPRLIQEMVYNNLMLMDRYIPGFQQVIYTNISLLEILAKIEV